MRRRGQVLAVVLFVLMAIGVAPSAAATPTIEPGSGHRATASAYWRKCGSQPRPGAGWYRVRAHGLYCRKARAVAKRYVYGLAYNPSPSPLGFSCRHRRIGYELSRAACRRVIGGRVQKVRFLFGA